MAAHTCFDYDYWRLRAMLNLFSRRFHRHFSHFISRSESALTLKFTLMLRAIGYCCHACHAPTQIAFRYNEKSRQIYTGDIFRILSIRDHFTTHIYRATTIYTYMPYHDAAFYASAICVPYSVSTLPFTRRYHYYSCPQYHLFPIFDRVLMLPIILI